MLGLIQLGENMTFNILHPQSVPNIEPVHMSQEAGLNAQMPSFASATTTSIKPTEYYITEDVAAAGKDPHLCTQHLLDHCNNTMPHLARATSTMPPAVRPSQLRFTSSTDASRTCRKQASCSQNRLITYPSLL